MCPGRAAAFFTLVRRAGTVPNAGVRYGPGSAAHHAAEEAARCAASGARLPQPALVTDRAEVLVDAEHDQHEFGDDAREHDTDNDAGDRRQYDDEAAERADCH